MTPLENPTDDISLSIVKAKYLPSLSTETIERMCRNKVFKTATKPGGTKHAHWRVKRSEAQAIAYRSSAAFVVNPINNP